MAPIKHPQKREPRTRHIIWPTIRSAFNTFLQINGDQWAGAFAYNTFFALFPLTIVLVTITSFFIAHDVAVKKVIAFIESFAPISGEWQQQIAGTITGVINSREEVGFVAFALLVYATLRSFGTLISAVNRVWGTESYNFWRLPLKSLVLLGVTVGALLFGLITPVLLRSIRMLLSPMDDSLSLLFETGNYLVPLCAMFFGLSLFYKLSPTRPMKFSEVWVGALSATVLQVGSGSLFVIYLSSFAKLNAVYGSLGGIMALLLWIYLSGCFFIYGACMCSSLADLKSIKPNKINMSKPSSA